MIQSLLVSRVGLLQIIHHEVAVSEAAPCITIGRIYPKYRPEIIYRSRELIFRAQDAGNGDHGGDGVGVVMKGTFV